MAELGSSTELKQQSCLWFCSHLCWRLLLWPVETHTGSAKLLSQKIFGEKVDENIPTKTF